MCVCVLLGTGQVRTGWYIYIYELYIYYIILYYDYIFSIYMLIIYIYINEARKSEDATIAYMPGWWFRVFLATRMSANSQILMWRWLWPLWTSMDSVNFPQMTRICHDLVYPLGTGGVWPTPKCEYQELWRSKARVAPESLSPRKWSVQGVGPWNFQWILPQNGLLGRDHQTIQHDSTIFNSFCTKGCCLPTMWAIVPPSVLVSWPSRWCQTLGIKELIALPFEEYPLVN